jgi:hypothetical protein
LDLSRIAILSVQFAHAEPAARLLWKAKNFSQNFSLGDVERGLAKSSTKNFKKR